MNFQFMSDITGLPIAKCDLECEAFGDWLSHDLSIKKNEIASLLETVNKLLTKQLSHYEYIGKEYHLIFENDEVELTLNNQEVSQSEFAEGFEQDSCGCGLVDFQSLLQEWQQFIKHK